MKEMQDFADAFTQMVEALIANHVPHEPYVPQPVQDLAALERRILAMEVRFGEVHRLVDQHDHRIDIQLSRITELEIKSITNGNNAT